MKILCRRGKFRDTEEVFRHHLFGIGTDTDVVFGISVPEITAGSTDIPKYRIPSDIPSSADIVGNGKGVFEKDGSHGKGPWPVG